MVRYFLKRLGMMLVALFMIILLTFVIEHSIPGGPFTSDRKVTPEVEAALNEKYHLNDPLPKQFLDYLVGILHGDLGPSYKYTGKGYVLPVITLGGYSVSYLARQMRSSLLEVMGQDYIRTARAKGLSETKVIFKHALRNALIPVITVLGPTIANLLTGSFVVEQIFAIPGLGVHFVNSVSQRDYTTIMGVTVFYAAFLLAMVFLVDIFYCLIDPRIKYD